MAEDILVTQKSQKAQKKVQNEGKCTKTCENMA